MYKRRKSNVKDIILITITAIMAMVFFLSCCCTNMNPFVQSVAIILPLLWILLFTIANANEI